MGGRVSIYTSTTLGGTLSVPSAQALHNSFGKCSTNNSRKCTCRDMKRSLGFVMRSLDTHKTEVQPSQLWQCPLCFWLFGQHWSTGGESDLWSVVSDHGNQIWPDLAQESCAGIRDQQNRLRHFNTVVWSDRVQVCDLSL